MSQHDWKPGDRAMVIVDRGVSKGMVALKSKDGVSAGVRIEALHPLSTPDPITDLERAVVEAAINQMEAQPEHSTIPFRTAVNALRARRPPQMVIYTDRLESALGSRIEKAVKILEGQTP